MLNPNAEASLSGLKFEAGPTVRGQVHIWRVWTSTIRGVSYLVATSDSTVIRLGGFTAPDLFTFSNAVPRPALTSQSLLEFGRLLAVIADPTGAGHYYLPYVSGDSVRAGALVQSWLNTTGRQGPDTVFTHSNQSIGVRVTVLSRPQFGPRPWKPIYYQFLFSKSGGLIGWARTEGRPLDVPVE